MAITHPPSAPQAVFAGDSRAWPFVTLGRKDRRSSTEGIDRFLRPDTCINHPVAPVAATLSEPSPQQPTLRLSAQRGDQQLILALYPRPFASGGQGELRVAANAAAPEESYVVKLTPRQAGDNADADSDEEVRSGALSGSQAAPLAAFRTPSTTALIMRPMSDDLESIVHSLDAGAVRAAVRSLVAARTLSKPLAQLAKLHGENQVHGDLKPNNIVVKLSAKQVSIELADFGLSTSPSHPDHDQRSAGAAAFRAPELWPEEGHVGPTAAADVWAAGLVLLILATGEHLFGVAWSGSADATAQAQAMVDLMAGADAYRTYRGASAEPQSPFTLRLAKIAHPHLRALVRQALSFDPSQRPSAAQLAATLRAIAHGSPGSAATRQADAVIVGARRLGRLMAPQLRGLRRHLRADSPPQSPPATRPEA